MVAGLLEFLYYLFHLSNLSFHYNTVSLSNEVTLRRTWSSYIAFDESAVSVFLVGLDTNLSSIKLKNKVIMAFRIRIEIQLGEIEIITFGP